MKKLFLFFVALCWMGCATAQAQNKYCKNYEEFANDQWTPLGEVTVEERSKTKQFFRGNDCNLLAGDKETEKTLRKEAFAVVVGDTIYVNCRKLRRQGEELRAGFAAAMRYGDDKLCFVNKRWGHDQVANEMGASLMFGLVGQSIQRSQNMKDRVCYLIDPKPVKDKYYEAVLMNDKFMDELLQGDEELKQEYYAVDKKKKRTQVENVLPILKKKGVVK